METKTVKKSEEFNEKIITTKTKFFSVLDDYKKYYVYYNKNPEVNEFQNYYENSKNQLKTLSKDLFMISDDINKNIVSLDEIMKDITKKLNDEKNLNKKLMDLISNLENTQNGSEILIDDSKKKYTEQYWMNWEIFIGILFVSLLLSKMFKHN